MSEKNSPPSQAASLLPSGSDPVAEELLRRRLPLTLESYLSLAYPLDPPPMDAELLLQVEQALAWARTQETEKEALPAEARRRSQARRSLTAQPAPTPASSL